MTMFLFSERRFPKVKAPLFHPRSFRSLRVLRLIRYICLLFLTFFVQLILLAILARSQNRPPKITLEIFTAPKPDPNAATYRAISSWLALKPRPIVTVLGNGTGLPELAASLHLRHDTKIDTTFLGVPLFNSIFHRANQSRASVAVIINADVLLYEDFVRSLLKVKRRFNDFLMVGARYDVDSLPPLPDADLRAWVAERGTLHTYGGMDFWAWNVPGPRLYDEAMPPFVFGRGKYDNWLTHETAVAGRRAVIDVSETVLSVHVRHGYAVKEGEARRKLHSFWAHGKTSKFELFINIYLSLRTGTYHNMLGTTLHAPWKLAACEESDHMCLIRRSRPGICNCEYASVVSKTQTDPRIDPRIGVAKPRCGDASIERPEDYDLPVRAFDTEGRFGMPLTASDALSTVAINRTVILSALNFGYRFMMMNWVCNMRRLRITNFVIAALDPELYTFAFSRGIASYYEDTFDKGLTAESMAEVGTYGTSHFKRLTKMKTRVVARVLRLGYQVVWSDCDVVFFRNPIPYLWTQKADIVIQSNAPDEEKSNEKGRINSGFYLIKRTRKTIAAIDDIIQHASLSEKSEQPSFYDVLCGSEKERTAKDNRCWYKGAAVQMLDRDLFPNGATKKMWDFPPGSIPTRYPNIYILHNNWVVGEKHKEKRLKKHGFQFYVKSEDVCSYAPLGKRIWN